MVTSQSNYIPLNGRWNCSAFRACKNKTRIIGVAFGLRAKQMFETMYGSVVFLPSIIYIIKYKAQRLLGAACAAVCVAGSLLQLQWLWNWNSHCSQETRMDMLRSFSISSDWCIHRISHRGKGLTKMSQKYQPFLPCLRAHLSPHE